MSKYSYFITDAANGRFGDKRIILQENGQFAGSLPYPKNAYGIRKVPPTTEEAAKIEEENTLRDAFLSSALHSWETRGVISPEVKEEIHKLAL